MKTNHGGNRKGAGRPVGSTSDDPRSKQLAARCTADEFKRLEQAAHAAGMSMSDYVRESVFNRIAVHQLLTAWGLNRTLMLYVKRLNC